MNNEQITVEFDENLSKMETELNALDSVFRKTTEQIANTTEKEWKRFIVSTDSVFRGDYLNSVDTFSFVTDTGNQASAYEFVTKSDKEHSLYLEDGLKTRNYPARKILASALDYIEASEFVLKGFDRAVDETLKSAK